MENSTQGPPRPAGDETIDEMLRRTVVRLGEVVAAQPSAPPCLWTLRFVDTDHSSEDGAAVVEVGDEGVSEVELEAYLPLAPVSWRAVPVPNMTFGHDPLRSLVGWEPPEDAVGVVLAHARFTPVGRTWLVVGVLRDGTCQVSLHAPGQNPAVIVDAVTPTPAEQALKRCLGLPSGLPEPDPWVLLARMHAGVLEAVAVLPDEKMPQREEFTQLLRMDDPAAAEQVEDTVTMWQEQGLPASTVHRGALVVTLACAPSVAASLVSHPLAGALIPMVGDVEEWSTVVSRLRASPPDTSTVPPAWWRWADDAMIAAVISAALPPLGALTKMEQLVSVGALPELAVEMSASAVARIAAGTFV